MPIHFMESWASACLIVTSEDKYNNHEHPCILFFPSFYLWSVVNSPGCAAPGFLNGLSLLSSWQNRVGTRKLQCSASTAQQQRKHWCAINTVLVTNPKHSTIQAAMKKINVNSGRPSITLQLIFSPVDKLKNKGRPRNSALTVFLATQTFCIHSI